MPFEVANMGVVGDGLSHVVAIIGKRPAEPNAVDSWGLQTRIGGEVVWVNVRVV